MRTIDADAAWAAFERRDRSWDGRVIGAVRTTGIYCKPSCPARRPKREHVEFFLDAAGARAAGYRSCMRCKPDEVGREALAVTKAVKLIERAEEAISLSDLAEAVGYAPHHFQRVFTRALGVSPAGYWRGLRAKRAAEALEESDQVTEAIYEAGYSGPSRFYADAKERLGMTPSAWRDGGRGETIHWTVVDSALGPLLVAKTPKGICRLTFEEDESALRRNFPNANLVADDGSMAELIEGVLTAIDHPQSAPELPIDVRGLLTRPGEGKRREVEVVSLRERDPLAVRRGHRFVGVGSGATQVARNELVLTPDGAIFCAAERGATPCKPAVVGS